MVFFYVPGARRAGDRSLRLEAVPRSLDSPMTNNLLSTAAAFTLAAAALTCSPAGAQGAPAGDVAKGAQKNLMCTGCHGIDGWRTAFPEVYRVPRIGGQHEAYIVKALQQYKSGERMHPSMRAIAAPLSEQDMADLAAYYARGGINKTAGK
jgi:cytochrome c553